ncbi:MAG: DUF2332 domain-containing protein [Cumulibacter sp.]
MTGGHFYSDTSIPDLYRWFATETASSPTWQRLSTWIAQTEDIWPLLDSLPGKKRQPNVFLAALRYLEGPTDPGADFLAWVRQHWPDIRAVVLARDTQTNEPGRCANLAPVLSSLGEKIALIEVGMSAGLCLFPDRYGYHWSLEDGSTVARGQDDVAVIECAVTGHSPVAYELPNVVWRAGIDLNPLNPSDPEDSKWLLSLVWPGQEHRERRLASALQMAAAEDVVRVRGDAIEQLPSLIAQAPEDATVVVMHTVVLAYFQRERRIEFEAMMADLPVRWLANEADRVLPGVANRIPSWDGPPSFVLSLDGQPLARTAPHGQFHHWL